MAAPTFEYLTGIARVPAAAPEQWRDEGLDAFYAHPNHPDWGPTLARVLYHESIHFWQFLASAYIANLVAEEWHRLEEFERTGEVEAQSEGVSDYTRGSPFSPHELVECWARYWDVHTRSPATIIAEDPQLERSDLLEIRFPDSATPDYTSVAFDQVMQEGRDCELYAAPYRWMLDEAGGSSYLVALTFPLICHQAFGSPQPVLVFCRAFERAIQEGPVKDGILAHKSGNINFDWLNNWSFVLGEAIRPVLSEESLPSFTSGFDVISRSTLLAGHPVFRDYLEWASILRGHTKFLKAVAPGGPALDPVGGLKEHEAFAIRDLASRDSSAVFGLPGQPDYRLLLGRDMPLPRVQFDNFACDARQPGTLKLKQMVGLREGDEAEHAARIDELEERVRRFRRAERAVSLGLSADAFVEAG